MNSADVFLFYFKAQTPFGLTSYSEVVSDSVLAFRSLGDGLACRPKLTPSLKLWSIYTPSLKLWSIYTPSLKLWSIYTPSLKLWRTQLA
jgi:hypothetical protein